MDIRVLQYFLAVAREESITGAAETLHVTQPNLSRQIKDLEEELGAKLLIRGSRKVTLTQEGMRLRKRASELVALFEKTQAEFRETGTAIAGDIYIGAGETEAILLLAQAAKQLQATNPHITYHLFSGNALDVTERLDKGLLDFGVFIEPADLKKYDYLRLPATDTWGVLMTKDSPLAQQEEIRPEDLWDLPLMLSRQSLQQNEITNWLRRPLESLHIVSTYNLIYNVSLLVRAGLGYALTLDRLINTTGDSNLCFRPLKPRLEVGLNLVWKKYQVFSPATELFLKTMQQIIAQQTPQDL